MLGLVVGPNDGISEGCLDGIVDGDSLFVIVGVCDGDFDGTSLGAIPVSSQYIVFVLTL